jgi:hypothetical protein
LKKNVRAFDFFKVKVELKIVPLSGPTRSPFQIDFEKKFSKSKSFLTLKKLKSLNYLIFYHAYCTYDALIPVVIDAAISAVDAVISVINRQDTVIPDVSGVMIPESIDAVIHVIYNLMCFIDTVILVLSTTQSQSQNKKKIRVPSNKKCGNH